MVFIFVPSIPRKIAKIMYSYPKFWPRDRLVFTQLVYPNFSPGLLITCTSMSLVAELLCARSSRCKGRVLAAGLPQDQRRLQFSHRRDSI